MMAIAALRSKLRLEFIYFFIISIKNGNVFFDEIVLVNK